MRPDLIAEDREGRPVLLVEVKAQVAPEADFTQLAAYLNSGHPAVPFGMLVDPERIRVLSNDGDGGTSLLFEIPTDEVFPNYDADFKKEPLPYESRRMFGYYLSGLVRAWLSDLAHRWKPTEPPWSKAIADAGLLGRLEGGTIIEEALVRDDPLR
jgi:hypothetical protein